MFFAITMVLYLVGIILPGMFLDRLSVNVGGSDYLWGLVVLMAGLALVA